MKKIILVLSLLLSLVACKSETVESSMKEVLNITDESKISDALETLDLTAGNDDYSINIKGVIAYHNYFMIFGSATDKDGNPVCIGDYTFSVNDLDTYDLNAYFYGVRSFDDGKYFILRSAFDGGDLMKGDKLNISVYSFAEASNGAYSWSGDYNQTKELDSPLLELELTINNVGKTSIYGDNEEIELTPFYLTVFTNEDLNNDSVAILDSSNKQLNLEGESAASYNEYIKYFDTYTDISNIGFIKVNDQTYEISGVK